PAPDRDRNYVGDGRMQTRHRQQRLLNHPIYPSRRGHRLNIADGGQGMNHVAERRGLDHQYAFSHRFTTMIPDLITRVAYTQTSNPHRISAIPRCTTGAQDRLHTCGPYILILVTGGAGFIGSNFILEWLAVEKSPVINLDKLTYAGNPENLAPVS